MLIQETAFIFHKSKQAKTRVTLKKLSSKINRTKVSFSSKYRDILRKIQTQRAEEISGLKFTDESIKFKTLGEHVSLDELKSLYKYKGP